MKKIFNIILPLLLVLGMSGCDPQVDDNYSLGKIEPVKPENLSFTKTASSTSENILTFTNTSDISGLYSVSWDLGNGVTGIAKSITTQYPYKGEYTVTMTVSGPDGSVASKSQIITVVNDDFSLINTPVYTMLTGGASNAVGKTWVLDQYNNFSEQVATATGMDIKGHMGLGAGNKYSQSWWAAEPNAKKDWVLYDTKFTFVQNGTKLTIENKGRGYGRLVCSKPPIANFDIIETVGEDAIFNYNGGNYTFSINESGKYPKLTLSANAFMSYYCGNQEYEIIYQTDEVMAVRVYNAYESLADNGQDWIFVYCLEELNVGEPPVEIVPKAIPLFEDFEGTPSVVFNAEDMGSRFSLAYQNPAPVPINESSKVCLYQKTEAFYSNIYFVAKDYVFDLTKQNKIKVKVFIPSFNDYTTEYPAGSGKKLLPQLEVKLQNANMGGDAYKTQEAVKIPDFEKGDKALEKDKWIELTFDFSKWMSRTDFNKIVIQFGGEGHAAPGIFYLDDFSFTE